MWCVGISYKKNFLVQTTVWRCQNPHSSALHSHPHRAPTWALAWHWGNLVQEMSLAESWSFCSSSQTWNPVTLRKMQEIFGPQQNRCFSAGHTRQRTVPIAVRNRKHIGALNKENKTQMLTSDLQKLLGIFQQSDRKTELWLCHDEIHISSPKSMGRKKRHYCSSWSQKQNER